MSPRLWRAIDPDMTRRLLSFAEPFPDEYVRLIADDNYWPDLSALIDDYLKWNPSRDRDLDMLPLLAFVDEERVRKKRCPREDQSATDFPLPSSRHAN